MSRSRSSVGSDSHYSTTDRLEPRLLRAVENDHVSALARIIEAARENGQFSENFLRVGLMRSSERGSIAVTQYLLNAGAKPDHTNNNRGLSPLLRAVERNHVRIVQLLLDYGASTETRDKKGRTALMTAAWKNHWHVLQALISRGADVKAKDHRARNVLHNLAADKICDWGDDVVGLLLGADCLVDGGLGHDELGRTPLHWACATGKLRLVELLLNRSSQTQSPTPGAPPDRPTTEVDAVELRGKTALHIAAAHDRDDIVEVLLRHGADLNARSDGGWTPLHNACDKGSEVIVRLLLKAGSKINSQLLNGVTPLHLAAQNGHRKVVECLLERQDLKRRSRDNFGSTPFLRAAQFHRKDIVSLLAPFNNVEALSEDAIGACEGFDATVVDFGNFHNENRVKKRTVYNLLYGRDTENPRKQAFSTIPADSKATDFRWIHLPANNMAWVEALLTKSFIEEGAHDVDGFKGLEKSFNYQHRGQRTHSHFMRPLCQSTPRGRRFREEESAEEKAEDPLPSIVINGLTTKSDGSQGKKPKSPGGKLERTDSSFSQDSQGKKGKGTPSKKTSNNRSGGTSTPNREAKSKSPLGKPQSPLSLCKDPGHLAACNVCMFMPYLHFETAERREKMQQAIQRAETLSFHSPGGFTRSRTRDEMLINAHLASSTASLHVRRTLDQFFYPNIDTQTRDRDQVVYRYQTKGQGQERWEDPKIFMVDQLWMWIVGPNLIVTSFPQRWDQPKNDPLNVLDGIIEDINSKTREPVRSVYDLAITITNRCCGIFDRHRMGDEEYQFLDMFESSIGIATDRETVLFQEFNRASSQASDWLKNHRKLSRFARSLPEAGTNSDEQGLKNYEQDEQEQEPLFVDNLLDIGQETDLLSEAKDIRDELNMIRTILEHQQNVLSDLQDVICEIYHGQHRSQHEVKKRFKDQHRTIDMHVKDIDRMDKQAERIYNSITDLLDLKQKHANAFEARFARDQAAGTAKVSQTILVFTLVTIIFLPLSFITSVFAVNTAEFGGSEKLHLSYVAKYTFGIGFAISIPLIIVALSVDDIGDFFREGMRRVRKRLGKTPSGGGKHPQHAHALEKHQAQTVEMERIWSKARTIRRSVQSEYAPGELLPVSTRDTRRSNYQWEYK